MNKEDIEYIVYTISDEAYKALLDRGLAYGLEIYKSELTERLTGLGLGLNEFYSRIYAQDIVRCIDDYLYVNGFNGRLSPRNLPMFFTDTFREGLRKKMYNDLAPFLETLEIKKPNDQSSE